MTYFTRYFLWYDTEHYHSTIDFVSPQKAHNGLLQDILKERRAEAFSQRRRHQEENQEPRNIDQPVPRSVINRAVRSLIQKCAGTDL